jgi:hypothetical protein
MALYLAIDVAIDVTIYLAICGRGGVLEVL